MTIPSGFQKAKLDIEGGDSIECAFNPQSYTIAKANVWTYKPTQGKDLPDIIFAILNRSKDAENLPAQNAWKIDQQAAKFVRMSTNGLLCPKSGIYTVDGGM